MISEQTKIQQTHVIYSQQPMRSALEQLNAIEGAAMTLFAVDSNEKMVGTLTDGDVRRALLSGITLDDPVSDCMNKKFHYLMRGNFSLDQVKSFKKEGIHLIPMLDDQNRILKIIDFSRKKSVLPIDVMIMAGGRGSRLQPLTDETPKPLLKVDGKPIIEHNIDRLIAYGVDNFHISIKYLGKQIVDYLGDGASKKVNINYVREEEPLGTMGSLGLVETLENPHILVMNSDLLTNLDFEDFFRYFIESQADLTVATTPYKVKVPYAVLESENDRIISFKEKPTYTYYSNAGIYLMSKRCLEYIPANNFYNATDLIEKLIEEKKKVTHFPILGYWLDIGRKEDFFKAQEDIKHIQF